MSARPQWDIATAHLQRGVPGLRFKRTLHGCDAAFPNSPEYANAIEPHDISARLDWRLLDLLTCAALVVAIACAVLGWLP